MPQSDHVVDLCGCLTFAHIRFEDIDNANVTKSYSCVAGNKYPGEPKRATCLAPNGIVLKKLR